MVNGTNSKNGLEKWCVEKSADRQRAAARFNQPTGLALDVDDHLIVSDTVNHCIRKVTTAEGRVTTVAGRAGQHGFADGEGAAARFHHPQGITVDDNNKILVADTQNHRIRMIAGANARVTTVSGNAAIGAEDGASARFNAPFDLVLDEGGRLLVIEIARSVLRVIKASQTPPWLLAHSAGCTASSPGGLEQSVRGHGADRRDVCSGRAALLGAPLRAGCAEPLLSWTVQIGKRHERGLVEVSWGRHCDRGGERWGVSCAAAVPLHTQSS